jgi:hypothetical protein
VHGAFWDDHQMLAIIDEIGKTKMSHKMNNQAPEQGLNEDRMLTTLRNNGSNKGHSLCKLSTFRASITTLHVHDDHNIHLRVLQSLHRHEQGLRVTAHTQIAKDSSKDPASLYHLPWKRTARFDRP